MKTMQTILSRAVRWTAVVLAWVCLAAGHTFATVRYVNLTSPAPAPPYTTWASAATNIQGALDAAQAGDTVLDANGVYATGGRAVDGLMPTGWRWTNRWRSVV